jgi:hypothetical protein
VKDVLIKRSLAHFLDYNAGYVLLTYTRGQVTTRDLNLSNGNIQPSNMTTNY